jgi:hypothetical protein
MGFCLGVKRRCASVRLGTIPPCEQARLESAITPYGTVPSTGLIRATPGFVSGLRCGCFHRSYPPDARRQPLRYAVPPEQPLPDGRSDATGYKLYVLFGCCDPRLALDRAQLAPAQSQRQEDAHCHRQMGMAPGGRAGTTVAGGGGGGGIWTAATLRVVIEAFLHGQLLTDHGATP